MEPSRIKDAISMTDVCARYGIEINPQGYALCPFHGEKTPSMRIYPGSRGFCCFGCGVSGDVIDFAKDYFHLSFREAVDKLAQDFGLVTYSTGSAYADAAAAKAEWRRQQERKRRREAVEKAEAEYWRVFDAWHALDEFCREERPADPDHVHPLFPRAIALRERYKEELEYAGMRRRRHGE